MFICLITRGDFVILRVYLEDNALSYSKYLLVQYVRYEHVTTCLYVL